MEAKLPSALMAEMLKDMWHNEDVLTSLSLCLTRKRKPEFAEDMALSAFLFPDTHTAAESRSIDVMQDRILAYVQKKQLSSHVFILLPHPTCFKRCEEKQDFGGGLLLFVSVLVFYCCCLFCFFEIGS